MKKTIIFILITLGVIFTTNAFAAEPIKEYRYPLVRDARTLDPIYMSDPSSYEVGSQLYNGLVTYRPIAKSKWETPYDIIPDLAESWQISDDRRSYTFKLRKNVRFHNGRIFESRDVKKSFERIINPKNNSYGNWTLAYLPIVGIENFRAQCMRNVPIPDLKGIQVIDFNLVRITLTRPVPYALNILAMPYYYIMPADGGFHTIGTGPYKLKEWKKKQYISLVKNSYYFEKYRPYIPNLKYVVFSSETEAFKAFHNGQTECADIPPKYFNDIVNNSDWNKMGADNLEDMNSLNDRNKSFVIKSPLNKIEYIVMNNKSFPFNKLKTRQAFNYAINKNKLVEQVLNYQAAPFLSFNLKNPYSSEFPYSYDPLKAKKLLYEADWRDKNRDGFIEPPGRANIILYHEKNDYARKVCKSIQEDLNDIGVKISLKETDSPATRNFPFFYTSFKPQFMDLGRIFSPMFYSSNISNKSKYKNVKVNRLLKSSEKIQDDAYRTKSYLEAEKIIFEQAPDIFLTQSVGYKVVQPYIKGQIIHPVMPTLVKLIKLQQ